MIHRNGFFSSDDKFKQPITDKEYRRAQHLFDEVENLNQDINENFNQPDKVGRLRKQRERKERELDKLNKRMDKRRNGATTLNESNAYTLFLKEIAVLSSWLNSGKANAAKLKKQYNKCLATLEAINDFYSRRELESDLSVLAECLYDSDIWQASRIISNIENLGFRLRNGIEADGEVKQNGLSLRGDLDYLYSDEPRPKLTAKEQQQEAERELERFVDNAIDAIKTNRFYDDDRDNGIYTVQRLAIAADVPYDEAYRMITQTFDIVDKVYIGQRNGVSKRRKTRRNFAIETDDEEISYLQARQMPYFQDTTDIRELSEMFQGQVNEDEAELLISRYGVPNLSRLGNLEYIILEIAGGDYEKIEFDDETSFLCADRRKNLYLAGIGCVFETADRPELGSISILGRVYEIMYRTRKAHIEDNKIVSFYHNLGEVDGILPYLAIDDEGFPLPLIGGNYTIKREGVIN